MIPNAATRRTSTIALIALSLVLCSALPAQQLSEAEVIRRADAAVASRFDNVLGFTATEHYIIYRGSDESHPAAELTALDTYKKGAGKTYTVLSESGSRLLIHFGLKPLLARETEVNLPGNVEKSWFISANYTMHLRPGGIQKIDGRDCYGLAISPKHNAPNMIVGTMWVDAQDGTMVRVEGVASQSPSALTDVPRMMRKYTKIDGYSMSQHARAESSSFLYGRTVVTIDYSNYNLQVRTKK